MSGARGSQITRFFCVSGVNLWSEELSTAVKEKIEDHWRRNLRDVPFDENSEKQKFYVLSMFPYPSGQLHMGHVRVYSISDAIARFHRMRGQNVLQPMGWDAFGLPAENAARDRKLDPDRWTQSNIATMKDQMETLNFSFDWSREFATCDSDYYKWTQYLFLKMYENGLVYRKEALVNWDPVDETVLADEQVDASGRSWRSGAKVVKKKLKQWFIRTTRYSKALYDGLDDPDLKDWKDIIKIQKHWIGDCNGTNIDFELVDQPETLTVWLKEPEFIDQGQFIAIKSKSFWDGQKISVKNPLTSDVLPVFVCDDFEYPAGCDTYLGLPDLREADKAFAVAHGVYRDKIKPLMTEGEQRAYRKKICAEAKRRGIGGWPTSSKIRDWLISRQRFWGTPIPIVHCPSCGPQAVPEQLLPVKPNDTKEVSCPKCSSPAVRETDTMDTFVDSSWYYLRFLDPDNTEIPFSPEKSTKFMPVDIYVGGKEHAVLHLYYARFVGHFLSSAGVLPTKEPFKRLLVQGIVKGKTYRSKTSGEYVRAEDVDVKSGLSKTGEVLTTTWEKMSKSKFNGVDPLEMFEEFGCDTTRLIILADVAPTSSRNWSRDTFQGVLKWQHRLWLTLQNFIKIRQENEKKVAENSEELAKEEAFLCDSRNYYVKGVTFNFVESYQLSVAISKMQGLTNSLRKSSKTAIAFGEEYEKALAVQIIMLAPIAPHFAAELWAGFLQAPNRLSDRIIWDKPVNLQPWPKVDSNYCLDLQIRVNGKDVNDIKISKCDFDQLRHADALRLAQADPKVAAVLARNLIVRTSFQKKKDCTAILTYVSQAPKHCDLSNSEEDSCLKTEASN